MSEATYISTTDTAKMLRRHLKAAFPGVKFSVRSHKYAGGSSLDVYWTDGPTDDQVKPLAHIYQGANFDGMTDSTSFHDQLVALDDGELPELVHFGPHFVFTHRTNSDALLEAAAGMLEPASCRACVCDRCQRAIPDGGGFSWDGDRRLWTFCSTECGAPSVAHQVNGADLDHLSN